MSTPKILKPAGHQTYSSESCHEGTKSWGVRGRRCSDGAECSVLDIELAPAFHLRFIVRSSAILIAILGVDIGIDVFVNVIWKGLIHLLVGTAVTALAAQWTRWAFALIGISFVVALGPS